MPQTFLGLEIGQTTIKAAVLTRKGLTGGHILAARILNIEDCGGIEPALKKLAEDKIFCGIPCCLSLAPKEIMFRQVNLPFRDDNRIRKTLAFELEPLIPLPVEDVIIDYLMIPHDGLFVAALAKNNVRYWIEQVENTLGEVSVIDASPSVLASQITENKKHAGCGMILDIGHLTTNVAFYENNDIIHLRSLAFGGNMITEAMTRDQSVTKEDAETLKISNPPPAGANTIAACRRICSELQNTIEYMKINGVLRNEPARITLTGGGSLFEPLRKEMGHTFSAPVEMLDLVQIRQLGIEENIRKHFQPQLMNTAVASTLRISAGRKSFNFRQGDFTAQHTGLNLKKQSRWAAIIAGIIVVLMAVNQGLDYGLKTKHLNGIKKQIASAFKKNFPEAASMVDPVQQLKARLEDNKKTFGFYEGLPDTTVVELLKEISALVPPSINMILTGWTYENGIISMKGEAKTIDEITAVKNELSRSKYFKDVTMGTTSLTKDGGKVEFNLRIQVK